MLVRVLIVCVWVLGGHGRITAADAEALPVAVPPDASELLREGRFSDDHRFGWSAAGASIRFEGTAANAVLRLTAGGGSVVQVVVDGEPTEALVISRDQRVYRLAEDLSPGEHVVGFRKRPEGFAGEIAFEGFQLSAGAEVLPLEPSGRRIMVIGDSISCGYGNEAAEPKEGNSYHNENGYLAYGPLAARALGAEVMMVCWSGKGMYRNRNEGDDRSETIPALFDRALPLDPDSTFDHASWVPDVIVINLGTNDLARGRDKAKPELTQDDYLGAYRGFVQRLRGLYPEAAIIAAIGPMALEPISAWLPELTAEMEGVSFLQFDPRRGMEWVGGHWHPSVKMHRVMATTLVARIGELTGWEPVEQP